MRTESIELPSRPRTATLIFNQNAGLTPVSVDSLSQHLSASGMKVVIRQAPPGQIHQVVKDAIREQPDVLIAAGGDGTVSAVASALVGSQILLAVLPIGTLNHFARDLGIPTDLEEAVRIIGTGHVRQVDVGEVNGRTFVNNCSIGLYPRIVRRRDGQRHRWQRGKWVAMVLAAMSVFRRYPLVRVELDTNERQVRCSTPLVFVGNNRYETDLLNLGRRTTLESGELSVYLINAPGRWRLLKLALRIFFGGLEKAGDFEDIVTASVIIRTKKRRVRVALDGEVLRLHPPLECRIRPGALRVIAP